MTSATKGAAKKFKVQRHFGDGDPDDAGAKQAARTVNRRRVDVYRKQPRTMKGGPEPTPSLLFVSVARDSAEPAADDGAYARSPRKFKRGDFTGFLTDSSSPVHCGTGDIKRYADVEEIRGGI